jgi:hypothetical protein
LASKEEELEVVEKFVMVEAEREGWVSITVGVGWELRGLGVGVPGCGG